MKKPVAVDGVGDGRRKGGGGRWKKKKRRKGGLTGRRSGSGSGSLGVVRLGVT
jgi:hypothetical protein